MDNARTQLFKKLLRDLIARFVSVQRCTLGQPSMSASPVRDVDIVVQMWAGVVIHIHVIDEAIKANKVRRIIETATDNGIPVMFLLDAALMPANKAHISLDQWYVPFQSLVDDRAYCYKVENNQPVIFPMQFRPYSRIELEVSQGAPLTISSSVPLPTALVESFDDLSPSAVVRGVVIESDAAWLARARQLTGRVRLIGGDPLALAEAVGGNPDVTIYSAPVTTAGRIELLTFVREQAVSITAHRFGNPDRGMASLVV